MKNKLFLSVFLLSAAASLFALRVPAPEELPDEHLYGDRILFLQDNFREGNYRDYFQRSFAGELVWNQEGRKGAMAKVTYGSSRPFAVKPGKTYILSMDIFNLGQKQGKADVKDMTPFLSFVFQNAEGTVVRSVKAKDIPDAEKTNPLPAQWVSLSYVVEVPENAVFFVFGINSNWKKFYGPYLLSNISLKEKE